MGPQDLRREVVQVSNRRGARSHTALRLVLVAVLALTNIAAGGSLRSAAEKHAFQREQPCPSTGERRGRCPGYVIDHVQPLCAGGADHRSNMQWQTTHDAAVKDREELRMCRAQRKTL